MSKHHNQNKRQEPIRNIHKFVTAYLGSETGKRALNRPPSYIERTAQDGKGRTVKWREFSGDNILIHAFAKMVGFKEA